MIVAIVRRAVTVAVTVAVVVAAAAAVAVAELCGWWLEASDFGRTRWHLPLAALAVAEEFCGWWHGLEAQARLQTACPGSATT